MTRADDAASKLAATLRERIAIVSDEESRRNPERHMDRLRKVSERINALAAQLAPPVDPRLQHYLERCSYDKALEFLQETKD